MTGVHILETLPEPRPSQPTLLYPGRVDRATVGLVVGPNTLGEYLTATAVVAWDGGTTAASFVWFAYGAYAHPEHRHTAFGHLARANPHRPWKAVR